MAISLTDFVTKINDGTLPSTAHGGTVGGKLTTVALGIVLAIYPLLESSAMEIPIVKTSVTLITGWGTWICSALLVLSGVLYTVYYIRNFLLQKRRVNP